MSENKLVDASLYTDQGQVRDHNEDFIGSCEPQNAENEADHGWLFIVADGVGGADAGEVASELACDYTIEHYVANPFKANLGERLRDSMQVANTKVRQYVAEHDNRRMATTMVAVAIQNEDAYFVNVGDSRGYHWRKGKFRQITKDHSLVARLVEEGAITEAEAEVHPRKNVILYSLGSEKTPQIDIFHLKLKRGDLLLLCSDGLTRHVKDEELASIITKYPPEKATHVLVDLANDRGGLDNITAVVIRYNGRKTAVVPTPEPPPPPLKTKRGVLVALILFAVIAAIIAWFFIRQPFLPS
jgi:protein phosphatase